MSDVDTPSGVPPFLPSLTGRPKPRRGREPSLGRMQTHFTNLLRDRDPTFRQMSDDLDDAATRIQEYLEAGPYLMETICQMASSSESRRRQRVGDGGAFGSIFGSRYMGEPIAEKLPDGVSWKGASVWAIRVFKGESWYEIAAGQGWSIDTIKESVQVFSRFISFYGLLNKEGSLK